MAEMSIRRSLSRSGNSLHVQSLRALQKRCPETPLHLVKDSEVVYIV